MKKHRPAGSLKSVTLVAGEALRSFIKDDCLTHASSLSFYATIALIPALFLLTYFNAFAEGISNLLIIKAVPTLEEFVPTYSNTVLKDLLRIASPTRATGALNLALLIWSLTPLISAIRKAIDSIYKTYSAQPYIWLKVLDVVLLGAFITSFSAIAAGGVLVQLMPSVLIPPFFANFLPFITVTLLLFLTYLAFSPKTKKRYLFIGALVSATLWFLMRPAFNLFLTYNAGFGLAFGSLKSIFVIIVWIYISQCFFLYGAEVSTILRKSEALIIKRLMDGKQAPRKFRSLIQRFDDNEIIFNEGEQSSEMYYILEGSVSIIKESTHVASIGPKQFFGEMPFLLDEPRTATVLCLEDVKLIRVSHENFDILMREHPEIIMQMLRAMARRLKDTTDIVA